MLRATMANPTLVGAMLVAIAAPTALAAERADFSPAPCAVEPRTKAEVDALVAMATPKAPDAGKAGVAGATRLPGAKPADERTIAAITATAREIAGCLNAEDWPRWLALMTDRAVRNTVDPADPGYYSRNAGERVPAGFEGNAIARVVVREARVSPDGRVRAEVRWAGEGVRVQVFQSVGDRWLLDEEILGRASAREGAGDAAAATDAPSATATRPSSNPSPTIRIGGVEIFEPGPGGATYEIDARVVVSRGHLRKDADRRIDVLPRCEPPAVIRTTTDTQVLVRCQEPTDRAGGMPVLFVIESMAWRPAGETGSGRTIVDSCEQAGILGPSVELSCSVLDPGLLDASPAAGP